MGSFSRQVEPEVLVARAPDCLLAAHRSRIAAANDPSAPSRLFMSVIAKMDYSHHQESSTTVPASAERVFAHIDEHAALSSHMSQPSWKMGGGKFDLTLDEGAGKSTGSRIRLSGNVFGISIRVDEIVTERTPPFRKTWETVGDPKLLVIGRYRMGVEITPQPTGSLLRVFLDYDLPTGTFLEKWAGYLLGEYYARWCTQQMADDTKAHFSIQAAEAR